MVLSNLFTKNLSSQFCTFKVACTGNLIAVNFVLFFLCAIGVIEIFEIIKLAIRNGKFTEYLTDLNLFKVTQIVGFNYEVSQANL